ncbi:ABC transporter ATP-binding protein [Glaciecola sp. KUL10]|uniref:ABC transporter ATP-binding protein n=1 Tax=Glaciecola sp. (strain KUL10) TaxID=2161813 RepID=UPI000D785F67|nr:ABC transporter ATP-binding protein [Glaciecola sp. KUL10]GBL04188.1 ABC transporter-like protein [Glaciecola sp. KUL10]
MIELKNVDKYYPSGLGKQFVFRNLTFDIPTNTNLALLGKNGAGKSTLFRMLAKSEYPNAGSISTQKNISWPVALSTGIHPAMTGRENTRFIGKVNGVEDLDLYEDKVLKFSELDKKFDLPVGTYSSGMRPRLAFACSIAIDFDVYLIDEVTSVGDAGFKRRARKALFNKSKTASVIMVSHSMSEVRLFCDSAIVLDKGKLEFFHDIEHAIEVYERL